MTLEPAKNLYALQLLLVRFEDRFAVLSHESAGEVRWPIKNLPDDVKPGDIVTLRVASPRAEEEEKYATMRKLLEDLIN